MSTTAGGSTAFISQDMSCVHCGYNLRGLTTDKLCPECGTPLARSIHGNLLRFADPAWLKKVRLGTNLKLWNILIMLVLSLCVGGWMRFAGGPSTTVALLLQLAGGALGLAATFLITTQEPRIALREDPVTLRKLIRVSAVAGVLGDTLSDLPTGLRLTTAVIIVLGLLTLAGAVTIFGELLYYRRFARRIPDERLARSTSVVLWGLPASFAILIVGAFATAALAAAGATGPPVPATPPGSTIATGPTAPASPAATPAPVPGGLTTPTGPAGPATGPPTVAVATATAGPGFYVGAGFSCLGILGLAVFGIWYIALLIMYAAAFKRALFESGRHEEPGDEIFTPPQETAPP